MTLVIAEAGVNHNGDLERAKEMVRAAARAGADLVKFQTFQASQLVRKDAPKARYQAETTGSGETQYDMIKRLELSRSDHEALLQTCAEEGIGFFSTGFDPESVDFLVELGIERLKVPSGELTNLPLLEHMAGKGLPVILSTGMATLQEIVDAVAVFEERGLERSKITVLHCNTEYPTPMADVNLSAMNAIGEALQVDVGYSDHTLGIEVAIAAVARGARVIEKHFTLDRNLPGPDHRASLVPDELAAMVEAIRNVEAALSGDGIKRPSPSEMGNRDVARRSLVAGRAISAGEAFTRDNLVAKRPGNGISPMRLPEIVGRIAVRDFAPDEMIEL
jgi:N,N'-diacetyllegionaminate synthase